ncbi:MAG: UPF0149 family protein [Xanthomonadales bacterium]|nr:UPF0149 family protein [Xanthomonadales bacterium]
MVDSLPDFDTLLMETRQELDAGALAEIHGAACGLLCRRPGSTSSDFFECLETLQLLESAGKGTRQALSGLFEIARAQLDDDQYRFELLLPPDDDALEDRTEALALWCTGMLAGMAGAGGQSLDGVSEEASEALADIGQIARAEVGSGDGGEAEEQALAEIVEYLRVVTLMLREEFRPPGPGESVH